MTETTATNTAPNKPVINSPTKGSRKHEDHRHSNRLMVLIESLALMFFQRVGEGE